MIPFLDSAMRMPMLPGFSFQVFLAGVPLAFQKVSSMTESIQTEPLIEGGVNHSVYSLRSPITEEKTLSFEKGIPVGNIGIETANIALSMQLFKVGNRFPFALILVCDHKISRVSRAYFVMGMVLKSWSLSELDANRSDYVIERLEFTYEMLERHVLNAPFVVGGAITGTVEAISNHIAPQKQEQEKKEQEQLNDSIEGHNDLGGAGSGAR
jgi:phage tail-like protein